MSVGSGQVRSKKKLRKNGAVLGELQSLEAELRAMVPLKTLRRNPFRCNL